MARANHLARKTEYGVKSGRTATGINIGLGRAKPTGRNRTFAAKTGTIRGSLPKVGGKMGSPV